MESLCSANGSHTPLSAQLVGQMHTRAPIVLTRSVTNSPTLASFFELSRSFPAHEFPGKIFTGKSTIIRGSARKVVNVPSKRKKDILRRLVTYLGMFGMKEVDGFRFLDEIPQFRRFPLRSCRWLVLLHLVLSFCQLRKRVPSWPTTARLEY